MITGDCKTCTPCEGCEPEKLFRSQDMVEGKIDPCDICDPCNSTFRCSYCGNAFCRCDHALETEEGPMHVDCANMELA